MSSRRKASTPCMIRPEQTPELHNEADQSNKTEKRENHFQEVFLEAEQPVGSNLAVKRLEPPEGPDKSKMEPLNPVKPKRRHLGGYECKYCTFSTQNLNSFKEHVDSNHPNVILNPLYLCAICNFNTKKFDTLTEHNEKCHAGESNFKFKRIKMNNQTILEQTIEGVVNSGVLYSTSGVVTGKGPGQGIPVCKSHTTNTGNSKVISTDRKVPESLRHKLTSDLTKEPITALNVNGTVIIPEATLLKADPLSHIMPSLQQPINFTQVPKIAVPLNTTKYNPSLDDNLTLMSSFNKFPYPTQAELSWLTAASKHPEEQIKVWFTTQRLKQGISWSPEEVEEARKKMFDGTISSVPQASTVVLPQRNSQANKMNHIIASKVQQPATPVLQILGQSSVVLTPVSKGSTIKCGPLALTVASQVAQSLSRPLATPVVYTDTKRPSIIQSLPASTAKLDFPHVNQSFTTDSCKTREQLSLLRSSYTKCPFPEEEEIYRLIETTGLSREEIKKWFSDQRLLNIKGGTPMPVLVKAEAPPPVRKTVLNQFPLLERVKGKSSDQLKALEETFQRSNSPTELELDQLAQETRLSKTEVDCWFLERRALRDNMEKVLHSISSKNSEDRAGGVLLNGASHPEQNGRSRHSSPQTSFLTSSYTPPVLAVSSPMSPPYPSRSPPILNLSNSISLPSVSSHSLRLLREMFCQTQWPSPDEYSQLEVQTNLGRTDIVRWFKDHRTALKNGETLDWMQASQKVAAQQRTSDQQNGQKQTSSFQIQAVSVEDSDVTVEAAGKSKQDKVRCFSGKELSLNSQNQRSSVAAKQGRWVNVSIAAAEETLTETDSDNMSVEQPQRVTV